MAHKADTMATTFKDKKPPKVVSHIEVHPSMGGGHAVHTVHTHGYGASAGGKELRRAARSGFAAEGPLARASCRADEHPDEGCCGR